MNEAQTIKTHYAVTKVTTISTNCNVCEGSGLVSNPFRYKVYKAPCTACDGRGVVISTICESIDLKRALADLGVMPTE